MAEPGDLRRHKPKRPRTYTRDTCPNKGHHSWMPSDIQDRVQWIIKMLPTHKQSKCPVCGLWVIWEPRGTDEAE